MYDSIIIGSGPAGTTAGIYLKRAGFRVLVVSKNESSLDRTDKIENYYGFENPISGLELKENGIMQAKRLGIEFLENEVINIKYGEDDYFEVITANQSPKQSYIAKTIVIATGVNRISPNIKGVKEFEGRGVSYCAVCDAAFYKNKDVAVLGSGEYAIGEANELLSVVNSVTMLTNGNESVENRDLGDSLKVNEKKIREFRGTNKIEEIEFEDNSTQKINGVFVAQGTASSLDFAKKLGAQVKNNYIQVNENMETTAQNVYACGDCTGGILQVSKAVYEGTKVGLEIIKKLRGDKKYE